MTVNIVQAGNTMRSTVTFVPASGTVALADVTARVLAPTGVITLTPATTGTNVFYADIDVPDTAESATWIVRWESNLPSPHISIEDNTTKLTVKPSAFPTP